MTPAAAELDELLGHPALRGRWPRGFTSDDVLDELAVRPAHDRVRDDDTAARFTCRVSSARAAGASFGAGRSLTAAALRCLIGPRRSWTRRSRAASTRSRALPPPRRSSCAPYGPRPVMFAAPQRAPRRTASAIGIPAASPVVSPAANESPAP